jgi:hypothetical protein
LPGGKVLAVFAFQKPEQIFTVENQLKNNLENVETGKTIRLADTGFTEQLAYLQ